MRSEQAYLCKVTVPVALLTGLLVWTIGLTRTALIAFAVSYFWVYLVGCNAYHRYWSHLQFSMTGFGQRLTAMLGLFAMVGDPLNYARTHRQHHAHPDTDLDPHSPVHGRLHAMGGWLFKPRTEVDWKYARHLLSPGLHWLRTLARYQVKIIWATLIVLGLISLHVLLGFLLCMIVSFLMEMSVNTFAHSPQGGAIDRKVLAWLALASYHKKHHEKPVVLHEGDPGWLILPLLKRL